MKFPHGFSHIRFKKKSHGNRMSSQHSMKLPFSACMPESRKKIWLQFVDYRSITDRDLHMILTGSKPLKYVGFFAEVPQPCLLSLTKKPIFVTNLLPHYRKNNTSRSANVDSFFRKLTCHSSRSKAASRQVSGPRWTRISQVKGWEYIRHQVPR